MNHIKIIFNLIVYTQICEIFTSEKNIVCYLVEISKDKAQKIVENSTKIRNGETKEMIESEELYKKEENYQFLIINKDTTDNMYEPEPGMENKQKFTDIIKNKLGNNNIFIYRIIIDYGNYTISDQEYSYDSKNIICSYFKAHITQPFDLFYLYNLNFNIKKTLENLLINYNYPKIYVIYSEKIDGSKIGSNDNNKGKKCCCH